MCHCCCCFFFFLFLTIVLIDIWSICQINGNSKLYSGSQLRRYNLFCRLHHNLLFDSLENKKNLAFFALICCFVYHSNNNNHSLFYLINQHMCQQYLSSSSCLLNKKKKFIRKCCRSVVIFTEYGEKSCVILATFIIILSSVTFKLFQRCIGKKKKKGKSKGNLVA